MGKVSLARILPTLILSALFLLFASQISFAQPQSAFIRQELGKVEKIWPGQRLTLNITLYTNSYFAGSTRFAIPEVSGMLVMENEDRPLVGTETVNGSPYIYKRHEIIIFPLRSGNPTLPALKVEFEISRENDKTEKQSFTTESIDLKILEIPGTTNQDKVITTSNLQVKEQWQPEPGEVKVGDALTRTITLTADDLPGMAFPPFGLQKVKGLGFYSKQPQVKDQRARGAFSGSRTETLTYVCEEAGTFKIPGTSFKWWNPKSETLKKVSLQEVEFKVSANPLLQKESPTATAAGSSDLPWRWAALLILFSALVYALFLFFHRKKQSHKEETKEPEKELFKKFQKAAASQNSEATMQTLLRWLDYSKFAGTPGSLERFYALAGDPELKKQIEFLETSLYATKHDRRWSGDKLSTAVRQARKNLKQRLSQTKPPNLPELNPSPPLAK